MHGGDPLGGDKGGQRPRETPRLICQFGEHTSLDSVPSLPRVQHIYTSAFTMRLATCINDRLVPTLLKMYIIIVRQDLSLEANFGEVSHEYREMRVTFHRQREYCFKAYILSFTGGWTRRAGSGGAAARGGVCASSWRGAKRRSRWREILAPRPGTPPRAE